MTQAKNAKTSLDAANHVKVWDGVVRATHWTLAACVLLNLLIIEHGTDAHEFIGYLAVAVVTLRILWGFIGSSYARFDDFFPTKKRMQQHIRHLADHFKTICITHCAVNSEPKYTAQPPSSSSLDKRHLGHNPLAALMMLALWAVILGLGLTGFMMNTDQFWGESWVETIHELLATSLYVLVPIHIAAAIIMSRLQRQNLIKAMVTGYKRKS